MAGSYNHAIDKKTGKLLQPRHLLAGAAETPGDTFETIEEMYGMIWWLADYVHGLVTTGDPEISAATFVEAARENYKEGLQLSPGIDGKREEED